MNYFSQKKIHLNCVLQKSFQALLPGMILVLGQSIESGDESAARQLFDVFETLLILVRLHFNFLLTWIHLRDARAGSANSWPTYC